MLKAQAASQGAVQMLRRRRRRRLARAHHRQSAPRHSQFENDWLASLRRRRPAMTEVDVVLETTSIVGSLVMVMVAEPFETWAPEMACSPVR